MTWGIAKPDSSLSPTERSEQQIAGVTERPIWVCVSDIAFKTALQ